VRAVRHAPGNRTARPGVLGTVERGGHLDDDELIDRAKTGDVAAYETLVRRYQDVAMRTAYVVAPEADAATVAPVTKLVTIPPAAPGTVTVKVLPV